MKTKQLVLASLFVVSIICAATSRAEDIDIYSGTTSNGVPNLMFVVDNPSSQNSNMGVCFYWDGTSPSEGNTSLGNDQCALANVVHEMTPIVAGSAVVKLGITTMCGIHFPLTPIDNNPHPGTPYTRTFNTGPCNAASDNITYTVPAGSTNKDAFIIAVKALKTNTGKSGQGSELQETWAYYTGGNDGTGSTGTGILTGTAYNAAAGVTTGCQKNYIIYLSGVKAGASHAQQYDATELSKLTAAINNEMAKRTVAHPDWGISAEQGAILNTAITPALEAGQGREWARFLRTIDINTTPAPVAPATTPPEGTGVQSIITYSIATGDTAVPPAAITNNMEAYIKAVSSYGGGKYYPVGADYNALKNAILKILNEVQAVNSVFSSSSLPVSVNAQGTYLNQIYMGMFRPDPVGNPRWVGNLKQYHFVATRDSLTQIISLSLSDSLNASAINPATGFITPSAVSFWTCGGDPSVRACSPTADVVGGFWVNDATKTADSVGKAYDLPDGEWVDKGGAAQIVRMTNLTNNYATAAGTATNPRKLYTCTGVCASGDSLSSYLFSSDPAVNPSLTSGAFGIITPVSITSLTRSGSTATATTAAAHGVTNGQVVQVSGANESEYNGSFVMTVVDATHVTYTPSVAPTTPATPATVTITASVPGAGVAISALTRAGSTVTVTVVGHTYIVGDSVSISGVTPTAYNGTWTITGVGVPTANDFTFTGTAEGPATPSGGGTAAVSGKTTRTIELVTAMQGQTATPGLVRAGTTVTVTTTANHGFATGDLVTIAGAGDSGYNIASRAITVPAGSAGNRVFTYTLTGTTPTTPPTVLGTASPVTVAPVNVSLLTRALGAGTAATATATTAASLTAAPYNKTINNTYSFSVSGASQAEYNGTFNATVTGDTTFTYPLTTTPATPATGTMTLGSSLATADLIKWIRGDDNFGDETGPGGSVTVRPSLHGDVLHSRPVAVNYGTHAINITATSDALGTRTATVSAANITTISALDATARSVTFANGQSCMVTVASATTFTYSATDCGASGAQTASVGPTVVVYYGGNDGVFRAVNGNQTAAMTTSGGTVPPGGELWGFIPSEHFSDLKRLHDNSPILQLPSTVAGISPTPQYKDYFVDGSTGIYQVLNADGTTAKAYLYLTMRRGGRYIYALNVTDPADPKYLWKITNAGNFTELGQTWSAPKVALIKGYTDAVTGLPKPVLIFGAGYDTAEDTEPAGADTMGRGIYIVDAETGVLVWRATYGAASACTAVGVSPATCTVSGMDYSVPADITLMDSDYDGYIDRLYAVDVGGNVWRVDTQRSAVNYTPDYWRVNKVASLGGTCCPLRKFFYPADVVPAGSYDALIVGSGDREHPLYTNAAADKQNRIFMLKDLSGNDGSGLTTIVRTKLFNATSASYTAAAAAEDGTAPNKGYYINLLDGEKVVNAPLTVAGYTYLGTNQPTAANTCSANLGIARGYRLGPLSGAYTSTVFAGGGLPPSPVAGVVSVTVAGESTPSLVPFVIGGGGDPGCVGADCSSALGGGKPTINVPTTRTRTYWYQEVD